MEVEHRSSEGDAFQGVRERPESRRTRDRSSRRLAGRAGDRSRVRTAINAFGAVEVGREPQCGRWSQGAVLYAHMLTLPSSPWRLPPQPGTQGSSCALSRHPFQPGETVFYGYLLAPRGKPCLLPLCHRCVSSTWIRRCRECRCVCCGRMFYVPRDRFLGLHRQCCLPRCATRWCYERRRRRILETS